MGQSARTIPSQSTTSTLSAAASSANQKDADGWDDDEDDWESFNDVKPKSAPQKAPLQPERKHVPSASSADLPMPSLAKLSVKPSPAAAPAPKQDSWTDDGGADDWSSTKFTPVNKDDSDKTSRMDEAKRKREERKQQRLKEIEAKRAANKTGPMKLGVSQKDKMLWDELE